MTGFGAQVSQMVGLLRKVVAIHEPACGNEKLAYGLDLCEDSGLFIGSFLHFGTVDLVTGSTAFETLNRLCDAVLAYFETEDFALNIRTYPGEGHDVCEHGKLPDLVTFALNHSGLSEEKQTEIAEALCA